MTLERLPACSRSANVQSCLSKRNRSHARRLEVAGVAVGYHNLSSYTMIRMGRTNLETPVALLVFNRPDTTAQVFSAIAGARPSRLLVVADGPRSHRPGEAEACAAARAITEQVNWPCAVSRDYSETNLGCARRVASGLNWVFEQVEEAIILEDDCVPHPTFFPYCEELLGRYRDDERVMHVGGTNVRGGRRIGDGSYYFSRYVHVWGWATWRRAWRHFDLPMAHWPGLRAGSLLEAVLADPWAARCWRQIFDAAYSRTIDTWDYAWVFACWRQNGLAVIPNENLVSNIGFCPEATHTWDPNSPAAELPTAALEFPLREPAAVVPDLAADRFTFERFFRTNPGRRARLLAIVEKMLLPRQGG